jgi:hypothetical protein
MSQLLQRYRQYRLVGFRPLDALRFAWLVAMAGARPVAIRLPRR